MAMESDGWFRISPWLWLWYDEGAILQKYLPGKNILNLMMRINFSFSEGGGEGSDIGAITN